MPKTRGARENRLLECTDLSMPSFFSKASRNGVAPGIQSEP